MAWLSQPLVVAWVITGFVAAGGIAFVLLDQSRNPLDFDETVESSPSMTSTEPVVAASAEAAVDSPTIPADHETADRFERLGDSLLAQVETTGAFPSGTVLAAQLTVEQRLSWQAALAERFESTPPPVSWDHPWTDPLNEAFVRRRLSEFQNPAISTLIGGDGYPATHFVGVAGVGSDAARVDAGHPRAGVFGDNRQTKSAEIRDGASQTWLVLGVRDHLGSWAAGGTPTVRALTGEPYVNGPDGFGTGQADSMLVLLADGRVQVVSAQADPRVIRSLATIADGAPRPEPAVDSDIDPSIEVEPVVAVTPGDGMSDDAPIDPVLAEEPQTGPRTIDIALALAQPIVSYEQSPARPLGELLPALSEMLGVPIRFDPAQPGTSAAAFKTAVQLRLKDTTVGAILEGLLKPAGLTFRVESDHVQLVPRE
ncbi:MAG: hypothetical protein EXS05_18935 [Planctomycetaceae bacterium]|nr:hypothetical protein [Planctomycetaceae bacterium]